MKLVATYAERQWIAGLLSGCCVTSLIQDFLGKEECLRRMNDNWVDWKITVPIAIVVWILVGFWSRRRKNEPID